MIGYGISARVINDICIKSRSEGIKSGYLRPKTLYPFPSKRIEELSKKSKILVIEMSTGQMVEDVKLAVNGKQEVHFYGVPGGNTFDTTVILETIKRIIK